MVVEKGHFIKDVKARDSRAFTKNVKMPKAQRCFDQGGAVAQSIERATPCEKVPGSIPSVAARSLLVR